MASNNGWALLVSLIMTCVLLLNWAVPVPLWSPLRLRSGWEAGFFTALTLLLSTVGCFCVVVVVVMLLSCLSY